VNTEIGDTFVDDEDIRIVAGIIKGQRVLEKTAEAYGQPYNVERLAAQESHMYRSLADEDKKAFENAAKQKNFYRIPRIRDDQCRKDYITNLVKTYKIHLMPQNSLQDTEKIFIKLL